MDPQDLGELLLLQSEGETLSFRLEPYPFLDVSDHDKASLIRDILAFANTRRSTDGFIIVGVEENERHRHVVGADQTLRGVDVHQFINTKTNRPVAFQITSVLHEEQEVTVIRIDQKQLRPLFLKKDFGHIRRNTVYVRRHTEVVEATPDEIAEIGREEMQAAPLLKQPEVKLEFEHRIETSRAGDLFRVRPLRAHKSMPVETHVLRVFAANYGTALANYVEGTISVPRMILCGHPDREALRRDSYEVEGMVKMSISNKVREQRAQAARTNRRWDPILPGERIQVMELRTFSRIELLALGTFNIEWEVQADNAHRQKSSINFADIAVTDKRQRDLRVH